MYEAEADMDVQRLAEIDAKIIDLKRLGANMDAAYWQGFAACYIEQNAMTGAQLAASVRVRMRHEGDVARSRGGRA